MGRVKDWLAEHDIEAADFPMALAFHEALALAIAGAAWTGCYYARPARLVAGGVGAATRGVRGATAAGPAASETAGAAKAGGAAKKAADKAFNAAMGKATGMMAGLQRRVPALRGGDTQRLTESLAESLVLRAAAKPVTFTFKMVATAQFVRSVQRARRRARGSSAAQRQ